ncbi:MAG: hypothetical protein K2O40_12350 [Lachnospiraceae bacterium]|nr:hypothetical protein [Lachnospiraceae bacterium]
MTTLKTRMITFITINTLLLCACGQSKTPTLPPATPQAAVECTMESIKNLDLDTLNQYTDNYVQTYHNWLGVPIENEYRVFNELLQPRSKHSRRYQSAYKLDQKIMECLTWEITDVQTDQDTAALDMVITNIDMAKVLETYECQILENMLESPGFGFAQLTADMAELAVGKDTLISILDDSIDDLDPDDLISIRVTVLAFQDNGQWKIHLSDDLINAFSGNMYTDTYTENIEENAEKLGKQLEIKMEHWAENFEKGFTNRAE